MKFLKKLFGNTEVKEPDDRVCHLKIDVDKDGNFWIDWGWDDVDSLLIFTGVLFRLSNGLMLDDILATIKKQCVEKNNEEAYNLILDTLNGLYASMANTQEQEIEEISKKLSSPLVKPTQVMNHD